MNQATYAMVASVLDSKSIEFTAQFSKPDEWTVLMHPKKSTGMTIMIPIRGDMTLTHFMIHVERHKRLFP